MAHVPPTVLIVEDNPLIAWDLQERMLELGCRVVGPAHGLADGYVAAAQGSFDLALLDFDLGSGVTPCRSPGSWASAASLMPS
jgi:DNA-binding response OmpR family regulator